MKVRGACNGCGFRRELISNEADPLDPHLRCAECQHVRNACAFGEMLALAEARALPLGRVDVKGNN